MKEGSVFLRDTKFLERIAYGIKLYYYLFKLSEVIDFNFRDVNHCSYL